MQLRQRVPFPRCTFLPGGSGLLLTLLDGTRGPRDLGDDRGPSACPVTLPCVLGVGCPKALPQVLETSEMSSSLLGETVPPPGPPQQPSVLCRPGERRVALALLHEPSSKASSCSALSALSGEEEPQERKDSFSLSSFCCA